MVNNAGTTHRNRPLLEVDEATFDRVYAVNVKSLYWMAQAAVPVLRRQGRGGSIINISSTAGIRPRPGLVWYNGTKGAVNTITQCMATELAPDNIRVNAVCPVIGATGLLTEFMGAPDTPETRARFLASIPLGRMSTPADIANACVCASPRMRHRSSPACCCRSMAGGARERVNILSIQSWVAYGHVGNAAAIFPLQRLGAEVWAVNTVQFSNHTGYGPGPARSSPARQIGALVDGIAARGVLAACDAVLSGYMGDAAIGEAILDAVARVRAANPAALWCCDPVIGDVEDGRLCPPRHRRVHARRARCPRPTSSPPTISSSSCSPAAPCATLAGGEAAPRSACTPPARARSSSPACAPKQRPTTRSICWFPRGVTHHLLRTPRLPIRLNGTGDAIAALFLFHRLRTGDARAALEAAASALHGVLRATLDAGARELALIAAQDEIVNPSLRFTSVPA